MKLTVLGARKTVACDDLRTRATASTSLSYYYSLNDFMRLHTY